MNHKTRIEMFRRFAEQNPNPTTELNYSSAYELLIAVILSAQATDRSVNKATNELFKVANTPQQMVALGEEKLRDYIKTIGLFRNKAKNVILCSQQLIDRFEGQVPQQRLALESLPGVGRKTANVILNTLFNQPTIAVDTHVFRVANRTGLAEGETVLEVETKLLKVIPKEYLTNAHHWLILHGRYVCKARFPSCSNCFLNDLCKYAIQQQKTIQKQKTML